MAHLRLDECLQVYGGNGTDQKGPVVYGDRWHIDNLILDAHPAEFVDDVSIGLYRSFVEPRNLIMKSQISDWLNKTVNVDVTLTAGEQIVMAVSGNTDPGAIFTCHVLGVRILATASYPDQITRFG